MVGRTQTQLAVGPAVVQIPIILMLVMAPQIKGMWEEKAQITVAVVVVVQVRLVTQTAPAARACHPM